MKKIITAVALLICLSTSVFAQGYDKNRYPSNDNTRRYDNGRNDTRLPANERQEALLINDLQREARGRIADGIATGSLTSQEAIRLLNEYERISYKEQRAKSNRDLSRKEVRELTDDLQKLMRGIRYQKVDTQYNADRMVQRRY